MLGRRDLSMVTHLSMVTLKNVWQAQLHGIMAKGGLLHVLVHCGRDLPKMDRFGKSDPYCVIEADGQKKKTKIRKKTLDPVWKECFTFKVTDTGTRVVVACYDWDFADAHDFMGQCTLKLDALLDGPVDQFYTLRDEDGNALQGSLRLQMSYQPADTGINDTKAAIAAAINTLSPEEQEEILGVVPNADFGSPTSGVRHAAKLGGGLGPLVDHGDEEPLEDKVKNGPPVHDLALREEAHQRALRQAALVERRRLDNLAEIERLRREQLRDEALERKIRQLSKVENLEDEQIALRRVEREEVEVEAALKSKLRNIGAIANVPRVDPAIPWDQNPALQIQASLDAQFQAMSEAASPPRRAPPPAQPLKPRPPEVVKRGEGGAGGGRPRPPSAKGQTGGVGMGGEGEGRGDDDGHVRKSVLTTMFGTGVSVEAKRKMMAELKAKKKGDGEDAEDFQKELKEAKRKMQEEQEKAQVERKRIEKLNSIEAHILKSPLYSNVSQEKYTGALTFQHVSHVSGTATAHCYAARAGGA